MGVAEWRAWGSVFRPEHLTAAALDCPTRLSSCRRLILPQESEVIAVHCSRWPERCEPRSITEDEARVYVFDPARFAQRVAQLLGFEGREPVVAHRDQPVLIGCEGRGSDLEHWWLAIEPSCPSLVQWFAGHSERQDAGRVLLVLTEAQRDFVLSRHSTRLDRVELLTDWVGVRVGGDVHHAKLARADQEEQGSRRAGGTGEHGTATGRCEAWLHTGGARVACDSVDGERIERLQTDGWPGGLLVDLMGQRIELLHDGTTHSIDERGVIGLMRALVACGGRWATTNDLQNTAWLAGASQRTIRAYARQLKRALAGWPHFESSIVEDQGRGSSWQMRWHARTPYDHAVLLPDAPTK